MKKIIIKFCFLFCFGFLQSCGGGDSNQGFVALRLEQRNAFNPDAPPGVIDNLKISVSSEGLKTPIVKYYSADTKKIKLDGFDAGSVLEITVEAINQNGFVIRRGYSDPVTIQSGEVAQSIVQIFNVPIFTNLRPKGYVNVDRFVPKIFASGGIQFQLSDTIDSVTTSLSDVVTDEMTFSISEDLFENSIRPIYVSALNDGPQTLNVNDPDTGEATNVEFIGYHSPSKKVLTTTAGSFLGVMGREGKNGTDIGSYFQIATEY